MSNQQGSGSGSDCEVHSGEPCKVLSDLALQRPAIAGRNGGTLRPAVRGHSSNLFGRKTAGASILEHVNTMGEEGLTEDAIRTIARGKNEPWTRRVAAERILRGLEAPDIADFQSLLSGETTLEELRQAGVSTKPIKRLKVKGGEYEIELHDRAGVDFDRIMDRTEGKARQHTEISGELAVTRVKRIILDLPTITFEPKAFENKQGSEA